jgi:hypothetical protein
MAQERRGPQLAAASPSPAAMGIQNRGECELVHGILESVSHPAALTLFLADDLGIGEIRSDRSKATELHWRFHGFGESAQETDFFKKELVMRKMKQ